MKSNAHTLARPSRGLRTVHALATGFLFIMLLFWLLVISLAAWLVYWVAPNIDHLRPKIESYVSAQMRQPVRIGHIAVLAQSWSLPRFELRDVRVLDAPDTPASATSTATPHDKPALLTLTRMEVSVTPTSLMQLSTEQIALEGLHLHVQRSQTGVWSVSGILANPKAKPGAALDWLLTQKEVVLTDSRIDFTDALLQQPQVTFTNAQLVLRNGLRSHHIRLDATSPKHWGGAFQILGQFRQPLLETSASRWQAWSGNVYAQVANLQGLGFSAYLPPSWHTSLSWIQNTRQVQTWAQINLGQIDNADVLVRDVPHLASQISAHINTKPKLAVQTEVELAHADAVGHIQATWRQTDQPRGHLDLKGLIKRADLTQLHRYLPAQTPDRARQFWESAFSSGTVRDMTVAVRGALKDFPFTQPNSGLLSASGKAADVNFVFDTKGAWPALQQSNFDFDLRSTTDGPALALTDIQTQWSDLPVKGDVHIADLRKPTLLIAAQAKAPTAQWLSTVQATPIQARIPAFLAGMKSEGSIDTQLQLQLPIGALAQTQVTGRARLQDATLTLHPQAPPLSHMKGELSFHNTDIKLQSLSGKALGGEFQLTGQLTATSQTATLSGSMDAQTLANWSSQQPASALSPILQRLAGQTNYLLQVNNNPDGLSVQMDSKLQGLSSTLPPPLAKVADTAWPLRLTYQNTKGASTASFALSDFLNYEQSTTAPHAQSTAQLYARMDLLDVDAWRSLVNKPSPPSTTPTTSNTTSSASLDKNLSAYIPKNVALEVKQLMFANRRFDQVVLGASEQGGAWRVNAQAQDFSGYFEYRPEQLMGRLAYLTIPDSTSKAQAEQLLAERIRKLPALDVVIDSFELSGKKLGRLDIQAVNQRVTSNLTATEEQEWRLQKLWLTNPDASFKAAGVWDGKRVDLQSLDLAIRDSGDLLTRLGMPSTIKEGKGSITGRVGWLGTPLSPHYPSMAGQLHLDFAKGQFLKFDPGAGRLLSVLSLQGLPRRFGLDFRDVFSDGFAFDNVTGDAVIRDGIAKTQNLQMNSVLAKVTVAGAADIAKETQSLQVLVLPDVNAGGLSVLAAIINPVVGAVTYLGQWLLGRPIQNAATRTYLIEGSWRDPKVNLIKNPAP